MAATSATLNPRDFQHPAGAPWSLQAAAAFLGVSQRHLTRVCDENEIKSFRVGRRRLIADAELRRVAEGRQ
jgi:excisionase family DNA binding protein